jgi:hypothetical protein
MCLSSLVPREYSLLEGYGCCLWLMAPSLVSFEVNNDESHTTNTACRALATRLCETQ